METESIAIVYQDHHLLVVNKPAGLVIHPTYKHASGTMWDELLALLKQQGADDWQPPQLPDDPRWAGAPAYIREMLRGKRTARQWREDGLLPRPCLLHRLDKGTSGIVALARTERCRRHIVRQFYDHSIDKRYLAVAHRGAQAWAEPRVALTVIKKGGHERGVRHQEAPDLHLHDEFVLDGPLQRDPEERRRCIVGPAGQAARTSLKVVALAQNNEFFLLEVSPLTGRTHQIRAHLAAWGYALVGDQLYGSPAQAGTPRAALKRQFLHAFSLELQRYPDNQRCTFSAPLAQDLLAWMMCYFPEGSGAIYVGPTLPA
jgi:23S rRNA pseudouridine1911/1915/1917 synthase